MPTAKWLGICIATGLIIGSGGGVALDVIAIGSLLSVAVFFLITALFRRSATTMKTDDNLNTPS